MNKMVRKTVISTCGILKTFQNMKRMQRKIAQMNSDKCSESVLIQSHEGNAVFHWIMLVCSVIRCGVVPNPKAQKQF
jgi:hypothetical protein